MSLYPQLDQLGTADLWRAFFDVAPEGPAFAFSWYAEIAQRLAEQSAVERQQLLKAASTADADHLRAILAALSLANHVVRYETSEQMAVLRLMADMLAHPEPTVRAEAIDGLWRLGDRDILDRVHIMASDSSPYVRGSVLRYRAHLERAAAVPALIEALGDKHFIVRETAADELGDLGALNASPHIRLLLNDPHPDVRLAAQTALDILEP